MSAQTRLIRIGRCDKKSGVNVREALAAKTPSEISDAIRAFSAADWARLKKVATLYVRPGMVAEDLIQEAFALALEGTRTCPANVDAVRFLCEAMRSIANGEQQKANRKPMLVSIEEGNGIADALSCPDSALSAETQLILNEQEARMRSDILALFDDDTTAKDLVEGTLEGMTADELKVLTGLDKTAYASKRRLIRRRINVRFPQGWQQ